jgi:tRNA uridine 5-carbamoylmethylation protein Kti12
LRELQEERIRRDKKVTGGYGMRETVGKSLVVNFYGGPGSGKSTKAAELFAVLKKRGIVCELVTEFAKDLTWEKSHATLENQLYVIGRQYNRMFRLNGKVDVIITDSPLLLSLHYCKRTRFETTWFEQMTKDLIGDFDNVHVVVSRDVPYERVGRNQSDEEADAISKSIHKLVKEYGECVGGIDSATTTTSGKIEDVVALVDHAIDGMEKSYCYKLPIR